MEKPPLNYAATVSNAAKPGPRLTPVVLANHPPAFVDNIPAILLNSLEDEQLCKRRENTLIMKFFAGSPKLFQIRDPIAVEWQLETPPAVGVLDARMLPCTWSPLRTLIGHSRATLTR